MPHHVVVDGSNLATEGRTHPSLKQLNEAVLAYIDEHPDALITVVVDATFGHRIDPKEVPEFDDAVSNNELVAPPAGAIGRGDAFVLSIANKVNATIISNDSYQEFHGEYPWLFDEGRLVGGKPVPHIGWVYVNRLPVRGPLSRKSVSEAKRRGGAPRGRASNDATVRVGSPDANLPMPVPKTPPPRAAAAAAAAAVADAPKAEKSGRRGRGGSGRGPKPEVASPTTDAVAVAAAAVAAAPNAPKNTVNDLLSFLTFVERHPAGTSVNAIVDHYSSHGAYVRIGEVVGYVPLRLMADPAPRSAREFMKVGESVTLVVESFVPAKRSVDLAIPTMGTAVPLGEPAPVKEAKPAKAPRATKAARPAKAAASKAVPEKPARAPRATKATAVAAPVEASVPVKKAAKATRAAKAPAATAAKAATKAAKPAKAAPATKAAKAPVAARPAAPAKAAKAPARKSAAKAAVAAAPAPAEPAPAAKRRARAKS